MRYPELLYISHEEFKPKRPGLGQLDTDGRGGNQCCFNSVPNPFNDQKINFILKPPKVQVNLCLKLLFLHQLTHNMTPDC